MTTPILFIDRDGTLIEEPPDFQVDALDKLRLVPGVIPALLQLQQAGWELVMVSNQDGLGTPAFPQAAFEAPHRLLMQVLESQGIRFREVLIDPSLPEDHSPARKPGIGLVLHYIQDRSVDWGRSAVIGDRPTDVEFAANLGIRAFQLKTPAFGGDWDWPAIAHALVTAPRHAEVVRSTRETRVRVALDLDRAIAPAIATGLAFFDHMLEQVGTHAGIALQVDVDGDLAVDAHHTVEDTGLALGQALREAVGSKRGLARYGFTLPMDEALAQAALDFSGRAYLVFEGSFRRPEIGGLPTEMVEHFFRSLCEGAGINLHLAVRGDNDHHQIEAAFKAFARALGQAVRRDGSALPSTKGAL